MNMKKTIAAIAAGAVAVSAMATTVSALSDQTLNYSLLSTGTYREAGNVNIVALFKNVQLGTDGVDNADKTGFLVKVKVNNHLNTFNDNKVNTITCNGIYTADNSRVDPITRSSNKSAENYAVTVAESGSLYMTVGVGEDLRAADTDLTISANIAHYVGVIDNINDAILDGTITVQYEIGTWWEYNNKTKEWHDVTPQFRSEKDAADKGWVWVVEQYVDEVRGDINPDNTGASDNGEIATSLETTANGFVGVKETEYKIPFKTQATDNRNVVDRLQRDCGYNNVLPVVNDAIANYDTVTFAFHTAKEKIKWIVDDDYSTRKSSYNAALVEANGNDARVKAIYSSEGDADGSYTSFTQHLYNNMQNAYGAGSSTWGGAFDSNYVGFDFNSQNLFGGALVVNENLTMSLNDLDYFVWNADTLSFDWDAIMDGAATSNQYATFVQSLKLATSTRWYWDSMDLVLVTAPADSVDTDASVDSDDETLDEEDVDTEEITDEEITDEEVTDEEEEEEVTTDEEEEDTTEEETTDEDTSVDTETEVSNPTTGNAPVALAVIPVALAAAAIVAKKRG